MLFNSAIFILLFLPVSLALYHGLRTYNHNLAVAVLVCCSLFFYGWWNPAYLLLLGLSIAVNFAIGTFVARHYEQWQRRLMTLIGIAFNLGLLGYFKYADFFISTINSMLGLKMATLNIVLPLAISFFTFQQITYLIDVHKGDNVRYSFLNYCLFVTFFPQLIAGPIVHHRQMMPQFERRDFSHTADHLALGLTLFSMGLFKKVFIADNLALFATPIFQAAERAQALTFADGWCAALAYTGQLYFDFSGYSDMAIGLGHLFGITLPINFFSPYKARNISEFWQRWHITLSTFLKDYLYIPLGGNRVNRAKQVRNLGITMFLGGLWHGAAWTFVFWGVLHGFYLACHHLWRSAAFAFFQSPTYQGLARLLAPVLTFIAVLVGWVFFRAPSFNGAIHILKAMFLPRALIDMVAMENLLQRAPEEALFWLSAAYLVIWLAPNPYQLLQAHRPATGLSRLLADAAGRRRWQPNTRWAMATAAMLVVALLNLANVSEFLYFQF
ncbi:MAG: membrane-bound O-acyltransferase family protein [Desulfobulbaceae bacterium]|nr:MAG: membrane-bound O-acyltransferase family protein [Desulfobulbaceae bacterium]